MTLRTRLACMGVALAVVVGGFAVSTARAAPFLIINLEVISAAMPVGSGTKTVTEKGVMFNFTTPTVPTGCTVTMGLYGYVLNMDVDPDNNMLYLVHGGLSTSMGGLLGSMVATIDGTFKKTGYKVGDKKDLDGDTDLDPGALPTADAGFVIFSQGDFGNDEPEWTEWDKERVFYGADYVGWKLGQVVLTLTAGQALNQSTDAWFMGREHLTLSPFIFYSDSTMPSGYIKESDELPDRSLMAFDIMGEPEDPAGERVHIVAMPEPATLALLGLGVVGLLARRRRK